MNDQDEVAQLHAVSRQRWTQAEYEAGHPINAYGVVSVGQVDVETKHEGVNRKMAEKRVSVGKMDVEDKSAGVGSNRKVWSYSG